MDISTHKIRIRNMERSLNKLDPDDDYELYIEILALLGTQYLNLILHHKGITPEQWDLLHSYKPALNDELNLSLTEVLPALDMKIPDDLMVLFRHLFFMEKLRPGYLRDDVEWNPMHGKECFEKLQEIKEYANRIG